MRSRSRCISNAGIDDDGRARDEARLRVPLCSNVGKGKKRERALPARRVAGEIHACIRERAATTSAYRRTLFSRGRAVPRAACAGASARWRGRGIGRRARARSTTTPAASSAKATKPPVPSATSARSVPGNTGSSGVGLSWTPLWNAAGTVSQRDGSPPLTRCPARRRPEPAISRVTPVRLLPSRASCRGTQAIRTGTRTGCGFPRRADRRRPVRTR